MTLFDACVMVDWPVFEVWPFETGPAIPDASIVLAEIYPSSRKGKIVEDRSGETIPDRAEVRFVVSTFQTLDGAGELAALFIGPVTLAEGEPTTVVEEEGRILGVQAA